MFELLKFIMILCGLVPAMLGLFLIFHVMRPQRSPADTSNRINKIRLVWFVLTREDLFVGVFPWLKHDELDNMKNPLDR